MANSAKTAPSAPTLFVSAAHGGTLSGVDCKQRDNHGGQNRKQIKLSLPKYPQPYMLPWYVTEFQISYKVAFAKHPLVRY